MNVKIKIRNSLCEFYQTFNKGDYFYTLEAAQSLAYGFGVNHYSLSSPSVGGFCHLAMLFKVVM